MLSTVGTRAGADPGWQDGGSMRLLPESPGARVLAYAVLVLAALALLWFWVFPWVDRTFVNRPAVETGLGLLRAFG